MISIQGIETVIIFGKCLECEARLVLVKNPKRQDAELPYCRNCLKRNWEILKKGKMKDLVK